MNHPIILQYLMDDRRSQLQMEGRHSQEIQRAMAEAKANPDLSGQMENRFFAVIQRETKYWMVQLVKAIRWI